MCLCCQTACFVHNSVWCVNVMRQSRAHISILHVCTTSNCSTGTAAWMLNWSGHLQRTVYIGCRGLIHTRCSYTCFRCVDIGWLSRTECSTSDAIAGSGTASGACMNPTRIMTLPVIASFHYTMATSNLYNQTQKFCTIQSRSIEHTTRESQLIDLHALVAQ